MSMGMAPPMLSFHTPYSTKSNKAFHTSPWPWPSSSSSPFHTPIAFSLPSAIWLPHNGQYCSCGTPPKHLFPPPKALLDSSSSNTTPAEGMETAVVVGAGPAGCLMAHYLLRRGFKVHVFERYPQVSRDEKGVAGFYTPGDARSYPILLSSRAIRAFEGAGLQLPLSVLKPLVGSLIYRPNGKKVEISYSNDPDLESFIVSRNSLVAFLQQSLLESNWSHNLCLHYGWEISTINENKTRAIFSPNPKYIKEIEGSLTGNAQQCIEVGFDLLIGADGVSSRVRSELLRLQESQQRSSSAICTPMSFEFTKNAESYKSFYIRPSLAKMSAFYEYQNRVQSWPSLNILLVNVSDGSFWGGSKNPELLSASSPAEVTRIFREKAPELFDLLLKEDPNFAERYCKQSSISFGGSVKLSRFHDGSILLIGDAAHAMFPSYGTGCNAALEDCPVFDDILKELTSSEEGKIPLHIATAEFTKRRLADAHAIVEMNSTLILFPRGLFGFAQSMLLATLHRWFPRFFGPTSYQLLWSSMPFSEIKKKKGEENIFFYSLIVILLFVIGLILKACIKKTIF